ncbi:MAG: M23 family metallopeptidase [Clostridia bacterium]|nr:M23 family metallopeptidase [Clostridia bacterium]
MYSSFFKYIFVIVIVVILFNIFYISTFSSFDTNNINDIDTTTISDNNSEFFWPLPNNHHFTSYFGKRKSPTSGASSYHSGVDVAASQGTKLYSCISGKVTYLGFKGAGGYTLTVTSGNISVSFCHISPNFLVNIGSLVKKGTHIANVGPKNVYGIKRKPL